MVGFHLACLLTNLAVHQMAPLGCLAYRADQEQ